MPERFKLDKLCIIKEVEKVLKCGRTFPTFRGH